MRLAALLLLAAWAAATDDCVVLDAPGASSIEVRSLDGKLMGNGTEVCLPEAHYRITLEGGGVPAVDMLGAHGRADAHAFAETDAGAVTVADAGTDARTDDGDARAHTGTVRGTDARALVTTDDRSALVEADASALLLVIVLERPDYG